MHAPEESHIALLLAETVGELKTRLDRVEVRFGAQQAPLYAAGKVIEASTQALATATAAIQAVTTHHAKLSRKPARQRTRKSKAS